MLIIWLIPLNQTKILLLMTNSKHLLMILKPYEKSKNRSQKLKKKLQNPITMGKILILKMHHHSKISQVRISMVILLTKVFFPKMQ